MLKLNQGQSGAVTGKLNQWKICIWKMEYQHQPLWIYQKWPPFCKYVSYEKISNYQCWQKWNISIGHYEKIKNGHHFINIVIILRKNSSSAERLKDWVSDLPHESPMCSLLHLRIFFSFESPLETQINKNLTGLHIVGLSIENLHDWLDEDLCYCVKGGTNHHLQEAEDMV